LSGTLQLHHCGLSSQAPSRKTSAPDQDENRRQMFDMLTGDVEGVDIELDTSIKAATRGQTGGRDRGPPFHEASGWALAGIQGAQKGGKKDISPTKMRRGRSTHLIGHMPRMKRSPGGRLAVGEVSVEHVACASSGRKEGQGWVGFQVATAQRSAGVSLPRRRWRGRRRLIAQAAGERGHLAARRVSLGGCMGTQDADPNLSEFSRPEASGTSMEA
jgi:hypothetical protein